MTITPPDQPVTSQSLHPTLKGGSDGVARRRTRATAVVAVLLMACLIIVGVVQIMSSPTRTRGGPQASSHNVLTCPGGHVKKVAMSQIAGGLGHAGLLVRATVTSAPGCTMSGYPIVGDVLTNGSTTMAGDMRLGYLGGFANEQTPLPRLSMSTQPRHVSFTIQMSGCNGPRPSVNAIGIRLPGLRKNLNVRSMYEGGIGVIRGFGIYCGQLFVTPLVNGSSGSVGWQ